MDAHSPFQPRAPYDVRWAAESDHAAHKAASEAVAPHIENPLFKRFTMPTREDLEQADLDAEAWIRREADWLDGSIRAQDEELKRLIAHLEGLELAQKVLVVFLSDHGTELLEHGRHWHGTTVYSELTDVPLVMWGPEFLPSGVIIREPVQLIDVLPTVAALVGQPVPDSAQGQSLLPLIEARASNGDAAALGWRRTPRFSEREGRGIFAGFFPDRSVAIHSGDWKLIRNTDPPEGWPKIELFHQIDDPRDSRNLADQHPEIVERLSNKIAEWERWARGRRVAATSTEGMNAEDLEKLRSLGYI